MATEYQECKAFWQFAQKMGWADDIIKHANERMDKGWFIRALVYIGMRKGLPDYQYIVANEKFHGLWMEFKRPELRGKKHNKEQNEWIARLLKRGHYARYVYGADDAIKLMMDYIHNRI